MSKIMKPTTKLLSAFVASHTSAFY